MKTLPGLAYGNVSLATGGHAGLARRLQGQAREEEARAHRESEAFWAQLDALGLTRPDRLALGWMVVQDELSRADALDLGRATVSAYPWYGR